MIRAPGGRIGAHDRPPGRHRSTCGEPSGEVGTDLIPPDLGVHEHTIEVEDDRDDPGHVGFGGGNCGIGGGPRRVGASSALSERPVRSMAANTAWANSPTSSALSSWPRSSTPSSWKFRSRCPPWISTASSPIWRAVPAHELAGRAGTLAGDVDADVDQQDARRRHHEDQVADRRVVAPDHPALGICWGAEQVECRADDDDDLGRHRVLPRRGVAPLAQPHRRPPTACPDRPARTEPEASTARSRRRHGVRPRPARTHRDRPLPYDGRVDVTFIPSVAALSGIGIVGGLSLLGRGMRGHGTADRITDTSTSVIASIAAGEVRVTGVIEAAEVTLVSLLQSVACVYYRAVVDVDRDSMTSEGGLVEERAVGFRVRDDSGTLRIFPRDARIDAPGTLEGSRGYLRRRAGRSGHPLGRRVPVRRAPTRPPRSPISSGSTTRPGWPAARRSSRVGRDASTTRPDWSRETWSRSWAQALPFSDLGDPTGADLGLGSGGLAGRS